MNQEIKIRYTYRRKKDGHIYQEIYSLGYLEDSCKHINSFHALMNNELWEIVGRDLWTGLTDKNNRDIFEKDKVKYKTHKGYGLPSFTAIVEWNKEQACFKYVVTSRKNYNLTGNFSDTDEVREDLLNYMKVVGNVHESKSKKTYGRNYKIRRTKKGQ